MKENSINPLDYKITESVQLNNDIKIIKTKLYSMPHHVR